MTDGIATAAAPGEDGSPPPSAPGEDRPRPGAARDGAAAVLLSALVAAALAAACGAPVSRPLDGPAADQVQASLDSGEAAFDHRRWDGLLARAVREEGIDYRLLQRERDRLDAYLERVAGADLASLAPDHLKALLINAYNAYTVRAILEHPGVSSIRDIDGVWTETERRVGGHGLTLDEIEHRLLRPFFRDPRIHFAVNCASRSCAPLPPWAFTGDSLDAQLERRTRAFLRDTANVRVEAGTLRLSRYFEWYGEDFTAEGWSPRAETIPLFVARYARPGVAELVRSRDGRPEVAFLPYDWSLNAATRPVPASDGEGGPSPEASDGARAPAAGAEPASAGDSAAEGSGASGPGATGAEPSASARESGWVTDLRRWVAGFGPAAPVLYGLAYVAATVLFVPGSALTVGAGVAFGLLWGTVLVSVASTVGAALAFLVARYVLRDRVARWVEGRRKFEVVDRAVGEKGWRIVALTRLSPILPFNLQNYAYGLTQVSFPGYVLASWAAMLPGTLLYVYLGAAGAQVAEAATGAAGWGRTALQVLGLLATLGVAWMAARIARRALREAAGEEAVEGDGGPTTEEGTVDDGAGAPEPGVPGASGPVGG